MKIAILAIGLSILMLALRATILPELSLFIVFGPIYFPILVATAVSLAVYILTWKIDRDNRSRR